MLQSSARPHFVVGSNSQQHNGSQPQIVGRHANEVGAGFDYGAEDDDEDEDEDEEEESDDYDPEQNHG